MGLFGQNLKFALRQLVRNPGYTVTVILTLALSIGANTAIFSIVNALMIRSLPYVDPERIGAVFERIGGARPYDGRAAIDGERWELLRDQVPALISAVSGGVSGVNLQAGQHVEYLHAGRISQHYLDVLGIQLLIGRNFTESEDLPHGARSAILSYRLWRSTFNEDRNLVGQPIRLKGEPYTVVGVLPDRATTPLSADIYVALQPSRAGEGGGTNFDVITRLKAGANWQQADAELNRAWASSAAERNHLHAGSRASYYSVPLKQGQSAELRPKALVLMLASAFILLIACANLAGLTLVRMARRSAEVATRLALGASRWQIQRQLWIENLVLALAGGVAGLGVGFLALRGLLSMLPEGFLPIAKVPLDGRVLAYTLLVSVLTSVLTGILPAFATRKVDLRSSIASRAVAGGDGLLLRQAMIAGEVALTVVLLAASGLLIRTLIHLETLPPGFNAAGVMTAKASLDDARYHDPAAFNHLLESTTFAMKRIPGVSDAAVGLTLPYEPALNGVVTLNDGQDTGKEVATDEVYVTPGYFDTLQIPLLAGRDFRGSDRPETQPVVIVNRTFANKFFRGVDPIGHTLNKGEVIVGVVGDVELSSLLDRLAPPLKNEETIYIPATQMNPQELELVHTWFQPSWIVRAAAPVNGLPEQMQRALASADPGLPFSGFYGMMELEAQTLSTQRIEVALVSAMGALALLLSTVGIFALVASTVAQRTREIGIRIALGSSIAQAMVQVAGSGVRASIAGLVVGLVLCVAALGGMRSVLYGVGVYDGPTMGMVVFSLLAVTLLAASLPVLRIARINPATTLREQ